MQRIASFACDVMKLRTKCERNPAILSSSAELLRWISMFELMTLNIALRVVLRCGIIFKSFNYDAMPSLTFDNLSLPEL